MWKSSHPLASLHPKQPNKLHSSNLESKQSQVICGFPLTLPGTSPPFFKYRHQAVSSFKRTKSRVTSLLLLALQSCRVPFCLTAPSWAHSHMILHMRIPWTLSHYAPRWAHTNFRQNLNSLFPATHIHLPHITAWGWFFFHTVLFNQIPAYRGWLHPCY